MGLVLLSISNLHSSLKKRKEICDRGDRAIRANVRGSSYQVYLDRKVTAKCRGGAHDSSPYRFQSGEWYCGRRSGISHRRRFCSIRQGVLLSAATSLTVGGGWTSTSSGNSYNFLRLMSPNLDPPDRNCQVMVLGPAKSILGVTCAPMYLVLILNH